MKTSFLAIIFVLGAQTAMASDCHKVTGVSSVINDPKRTDISAIGLENSKRVIQVLEVRGSAPVLVALHAKSTNQEVCLDKDDKGNIVQISLAPEKKK